MSDFLNTMFKVWNSIDANIATAVLYLLGAVVFTAFTIYRIRSSRSFTNISMVVFFDSFFVLSATVFGRYIDIITNMVKSSTRDGRMTLTEHTDSSLSLALVPGDLEKAIGVLVILSGLATLLAVIYDVKASKLPQDRLEGMHRLNGRQQAHINALHRQLRDYGVEPDPTSYEDLKLAFLDAPLPDWNPVKASKKKNVKPAASKRASTSSIPVVSKNTGSVRTVTAPTRTTSSSVTITKPAGRSNGSFYDWAEDDDQTSTPRATTSRPRSKAPANR